MSHVHVGLRDPKFPECIIIMGTVYSPSEAGLQKKQHLLTLDTWQGVHTK